MIHPLVQQSFHRALAAHWSQLPSGIPADVAHELEEAIDLAHMSQLETARENPIHPEEHEEYWAEVFEEFVQYLYDEKLRDLADWFEKSKARLKQRGTLEQKIKRSPGDRKGLLDRYHGIAKSVAKQFIERIHEDPDHHPDFDGWWRSALEGTYLRDVSPEAKKWAEKLGLA